MPTEVGYPYANFRLSEALTDAEVAALVAPGVDLKAATLSSDSVTVASQTIECHQLRDNVRSFTDNEVYADIDHSNIAGKARQSGQGKPTIDVQAKMYIDYTADHSYDVIIKDPTGYRLLYVERQTGRIFVMLCVIGEVRRTTGDQGELEADVTFRNAGSEIPAWE